MEDTNMILYILKSIALYSLGMYTFTSAQENLLQNPGFEGPVTGNDWFCNGGCHLDRVTDAQTQHFALKASQRTEHWHAISQTLDVEADSNYYFSAWVKLSNQLPGFMWHNVQLMIALDYVNGSETDYKLVASLPHMTTSLGWQKASGDVILDSREVSSARLFIQVGDYGVDYLVDSTSFVLLPRDTDWKTKAEANIEIYRKDNITINVAISEGISPGDIELEISQVNHHFAFGTAVKDHQIVDTDEDALKYQTCFYDNFEWSVLENALKWRKMEEERDVILYPDEVIDILHSNNVPIRGHTVFWGKPEFNPDWLVTLSRDEIQQEMTKRMDYLIPRYQGKLIHWDVNNELLHGDFYENSTEDAFMTHWMFEQVRQRDQNVTLFLNEYAIMSQGTMTQALVNTASQLRSLDADVGALGLQCHFKGVQDLSKITAFQLRLDTAATSGLPLWVTELDIDEVLDASQLAESYENVWTLFFSHPQVEGILLWGFHDANHPRPDAALFEGPDYEPNESGLRWQDLVFSRWRTPNTVFSPSQSEQSFVIRGFHGLHRILVRQTGDTVQTKDFYLYPGQPISIDIIID